MANGTTPVITDPAESRLKLYTLVSTKFNIGTFDEFDAKMNDQGSRGKFFNLVSNTFNIGTLEEFESKIVKKKVHWIRLLESLERVFQKIQTSIRHSLQKIQKVLVGRQNYLGRN